ncbi:MAG: Rhs element Vgr protein, partial [Bacteroidota bacterium]
MKNTKKQNPRTGGLITYTIKSEGSIIPDSYMVSSIYVERSVNKIPFCEIELLNGGVANEDFPISDSDTFVPGKEIEV